MDSLKPKAKKKDRSAVVQAGLGSASIEVTDRYGSAINEYLQGYKGTFDKNGELLDKGLRQISESKVHPGFEYANLKQQAGFSAEVHYENKVNAENIINKSSGRISRTDSVEGMVNHTRFDHITVDFDGNPLLDANGNPVWGAQMKFCGNFGSGEEIQKSAENLAQKLAGEKWERYRSNPINVPSEQAEKIKEYAATEAKKLSEKAAEFRSEGDLVKSELLERKAQAFQEVAKNVQDSGISSEQAMYLREHPGLATTQQVAETAHRAGLEQAKYGALIAGTISTAQNVLAVVRNEKEFKEAVKEVSLDTVQGGITSYGIAATGAAIKGALESSSNQVFNNLSRTNLPAMIAVTTIQVAKSLKKYLDGELTELELVEELGEKGTGMMAASMGAAIGTAIFPGLGTLVGGMVGYMASSTLYQSSLKILHQERLSDEKRQAIKALSEEAIVTIRRQRLALEAAIEKHFTKKAEVFKRSFHLLEVASNENRVNDFSNALNLIAEQFGETLKFKNFEEFDAFMSDHNTVFSF